MVMFKYPENHPRPLARHLGISLATCFFLLVSFVLFLLVGISTPIVKSIYLFNLQFTPTAGQPTTSVGTDIRFGAWGACIYSALQASAGTQVMECFGPQVGWTVPEDVVELTGMPQLVHDVVEGLTAVLVLHPVCAALAFICVFTSLFLESHNMAIASLVMAILTMLLGAVVFAADLALVLIAQIKIGALSDFQYTVSWGPGPWMVLVAFVLCFIGMVLLSVVVCGCCGVGREYKDEKMQEMSHVDH
ncbi:hypothetical protein CERSUDRAFT_118206 [Gelatoporia subvermispora B]|uniref:Pali-domain-containing protein n=1 Tax=Ceriporiopsis subvermispora (strain B) TaxID=914234 RepID=M2Q8G2_CERS8|nr:hypothetical protein CERSUDRAFT_118206 [Gelatoporia subvermispora B]